MTRALLTKPCNLFTPHHHRCLKNLQLIKAGLAEVEERAVVAEAGALHLLPFLQAPIHMQVPILTPALTHMQPPIPMHPLPHPMPNPETKSVIHTPVHTILHHLHMSKLVTTRPPLTLSPARGSVTMNQPTVMSKKVEAINPVGRGPNFTESEDLALCSSFLFVSKDPTVGANQSYEEYWDRIVDHFHQSPAYVCYRNKTSLRKHWLDISRQTNKFCGHWSTVERLNPSGLTEKDKVTSYDNAMIWLTSSFRT